MVDSVETLVILLGRTWELYKLPSRLTLDSPSGRQMIGRWGPPQ